MRVAALRNCEGFVHLVRERQIAPLKIPIRLRQRHHFLRSVTSQLQSKQALHGDLDDAGLRWDAVCVNLQAHRMT